MIIREHLWAQLFEGRSISVNPVLNCNLGSSLFCLKSFSCINFSLLFRASSHQIVDKMYQTNFLFQLSYLNSNLTLTLGYLNQALNYLAQIGRYWSALVVTNAGFSTSFFPRTRREENNCKFATYITKRNNGD